MFLFSCKDSAIKEKNSTLKTTISSATENVEELVSNKTYQDSEPQKAIYNALKKKTPLSNDQLFAILPKEINGHTPTNKYALQISNQLTSGMYGPIESHYSFFIQDGTGSSAVVRNFFDSYSIKSHGPPQTDYIYTERDGYKTIAFLQPTINRNEVRFVYNNRFRITLNGPDNPATLWSYIDFENLKTLDQYN